MEGREGVMGEYLAGRSGFEFHLSLSLFFAFFPSTLLLFLGAISNERIGW